MTDHAADFVWKLARRHSWGSPIPPDQLVRLVAGADDYDQMEEVLETQVLDLPFVVRTSRGVFIPNGQGSHVAAANWLGDHTDLDAFVIRATLSRLPDDWSTDDRE